MIHIGTKEYYESVQTILEGCDEIIFEGVRSFRVLLITTSYRWLTRRKRLGLITQAEGLKLDRLPARLVHADVTAKQFQANWGAIALHHRVALLALAPIVGVWLYLTASRESLGRRQSRDDLPGATETSLFESIPGLGNTILDSRDACLIAALDQARQQDRIGHRVGVVYGAAHMRAVVDFLMAQHGYRVRQSEWLMVMAYDS